MHAVLDVHQGSRFVCRESSYEADLECSLVVLEEVVQRGILVPLMMLVQVIFGSSWITET